VGAGFLVFELASLLPKAACQFHLSKLTDIEAGAATETGDFRDVDEAWAMNFSCESSSSDNPGNRR
jgi:hypothetical protein